MNMAKAESEKLNMNPERKPQIVRVLAALDDLGGRKYFLKDNEGGYWWLGVDLEDCEQVSEAQVFDAILNHGYQETKNAEEFEFSKRKEALS